MNTKNQKGFINIILIALIVAFMGATTYFIFIKKLHQKKSNSIISPYQDLSPTASPQATQPPITPPQQDDNHLIISEWGVEFEKPADMHDLNYAIRPSGDHAVGFSTQRLTDFKKSLTGKIDCTATIAALGTLVRTNNLSSFGDHYIPENVKIGDYYYSFGGPQEPCSVDDKVRELQDQQINALSASILKTLRATSANETTTWKTYQNNKYGFSVKYPPDWDVSALLLNCPSKEHPILEGHHQLGFVKGKYISTCLGPNIGGDFIIEVSADYPQKIAFGGKIISSKEAQVLIDGVQATMITGLRLGEGEINDGFAFTSVIIKKDDYYFLVSDSSGKMEGVANTEYKAIFEKFLSTFEFSK